MELRIFESRGGSQKVAYIHAITWKAVDPCHIVFIVGSNPPKDSPWSQLLIDVGVGGLPPCGAENF